MHSVKKIKKNAKKKILIPYPALETISNLNNYQWN